jgi:hypothetical protein
MMHNLTNGTGRCATMLPTKQKPTPKKPAAKKKPARLDFAQNALRVVERAIGGKLANTSAKRRD